MKIACYTLFGLWVVASATLKITGIVSWWVALAPLWFTAGVVLVLVLALLVSGSLLAWWAKRKVNKEPSSCANCLHSKVAKYAEDGKCLGEACDENICRGTLCKYYQRS